jgi:alpha-N-arabinofuranosidase
MIIKALEGSGWLKENIGAIKFHAPIDVLISGNRLHDAHKGMWMDWMTQGSRITGNVCYNNEMADLFAEVNHGPYLVDNNIFLSGIANWSEGGAYVHNLIAGDIRLQKVLDRSTPFHHPHTTAILGMSNTTLGDDRFYNNVFVAPADSVSSGEFSGLNAYNHMDYKHPVFINHNVYYGNALPFNGESENSVRSSQELNLSLVEKDGDLYLNMTMDGAASELDHPMIDTDILGMAVCTGQPWENPDGSPLQIDMDYFGKARRPEGPSAGPFEDPGTGPLVMKVWESR